MPNISYHLVMLVLKLKGLKKTFSKSPLDVKRLRKEDVHHPSNSLLSGTTSFTFHVQKALVTELAPEKAAATNSLLLYLPGGAFVYGPTDLNWKAVVRLVKSTATAAWVVDYPKAPEAKIQEIAATVNKVYAEAVKKYPSSNIILMGDSVGGNLLLSLVQRLIIAGETLPNKLIAICPVLDASMTNPEIQDIDKSDPILSTPGVLSAKKMCAGETSLKDPLISPLYGSFNGFPQTSIFIGENDIMRPDQQLAVEKMQAANVDVQVFEGKGMPHIWPLLPLMSDAKAALAQIERIILSQAPVGEVVKQDAS